MNAKKVLYVLLGLLAAAATTTSGFQAASSDSSLTSEEAAIPLCNQTELVIVGTVMTTNARKKQCQTELKVSEMLKTNDTKTLCATQSCVYALESVYPQIPNCRYMDWGIKYNVERLLKTCGIDPDTIPASSGATDDQTVDSSGSAATSAPVNWTSASSATTDFAPVGTTPTPTTAAPNTAQVPSPSPTSAGSVTYAAFAATGAVVTFIGYIAV